MSTSSFDPACNWLTRHFPFTVLRVALTVAAIVSATAFSAAAANLYVDDDDVTCGGNAPCFSTIQLAINAAAPSGDTIIVRPGTYTENVTLGKSVTIRGAQAGTPATSCRGSESTLTGLGNLFTLTTGSAGTIIDGMRFFGGVNNLISTSGPINNLQLLNNNFGGFSGSGVFLNDPGSDITVNRNLIDGSSKIGAGDLFHLDQDSFNGFRLTNNFIVSGAPATGFFVDGNRNVGPSATRTPLISGNFILNNQTGANIGRFAILNGTISDNTFANNAFDGLQGGPRNTLITGNTFITNGRHGLALTGFSGSVSADPTRGAIDNTITCNTFGGNGFTNAGAGISFSAFQFPGTISTNHVNLNNIQQNNIGAIYNGTEAIDAENNWWGSATGPTIASNPGGTGNSIVNPSGNLDYTPFLTSPSTCATQVVSPGNQHGWTIVTSSTATAGFVSGPGVPPLGSGSGQLSVGADGDGAAQFRQPNYDGTLLSALTLLSYSTYVSTPGSGGQAPYIILNIDLDNNGTVDDQMFFEPVYQNGTYTGDPVPNQCGSNPACVSLNTWQNWNALDGGWWTLNSGFFGPPLTTIASYAAANPGARIRNSGTGGGVRLVAGFGAPAWNNFVGNGDAFRIGVGGNVVTYDFEASQPTTMTKTAGDNQGTLVNTPFPINLQVTVLDEFGAGVAGIPVTFTPPSSGASGTFPTTCLTIIVITDANGVATAPQFTANSQAGSYIVTAEAPNLPTANFNLRNMISPTAADATISGQVVTPGGHPVAGVVISMSGTQTRKTITDASGNYRFDNVETNGFYTVTPWLSNYSFGPTSQSFSQLGNLTEAVFTATPDTVIVGNAIETPEYFVRQHYVDFLGREPDEAGFNFWSDQILGCGANVGCIERKRINVSAAYFLSIEFQRTGALVYGLYRASLGRRPQYDEFIPDTGIMARNVVVNRSGWEQQLRANQEAFVDAFAQRAEFKATFDSLTNESYVDTLVAHTGVAFTESERAALVGDLAGGRLTRARVLLRIAEDERFVTGKRNEAFVTMQYFGYLRRDPDNDGYLFWLKKLNDFGGNFERAEMVKAFITSGEYRNRFLR